MDIARHTRTHPADQPSKSSRRADLGRGSNGIGRGPHAAARPDGTRGLPSTNLTTAPHATATRVVVWRARHRRRCCPSRSLIRAAIPSWHVRLGYLLPPHRQRVSWNRLAFHASRTYPASALPPVLPLCNQPASGTIQTPCLVLVHSAERNNRWCFPVADGLASWSRCVRLSSLRLAATPFTRNRIWLSRSGPAVAAWGSPWP
jgi:hypothetical protein